MSPTSNDAHREDRHSPPRNSIDKRDVPPPQPRPAPRPVNRSFDLEPNPFEQSFSTNRAESTDRNNDDRSQEGDDAPKSKQDNEPKPVLPSLAALSSPSDGYSWTDLASSLRSGPLSPAMLQGPQQPQQPPSSNPLSLHAYDHTRAFGRTGLTPSTGLTPLVGGPVAFPPPSPNTAAFLAMVTNNNSSPSQLNATPATITPNTLSAITGMLNPNQASQSSGSIAPSATTSSAVSTTVPAHQQHNPAVANQGYQYGSGANTYPQNSAVATSAANGLFLLSQAHQELTKREEEQARADANTGIRRNSKRKSSDMIPAPANPARPQTKRPRANSSRGNKRSKGSTGSQEFDDDDSGEEDDNIHEFEKSTQSNGTNRKPETEEEKRRNFLERNRQAALKCRQRKKAWLAQLQAKVELLSTENERLTAALVSSREEISRLNALLGGAGPPQAGMGAVNTQPVSVAVTLPPAGKSVQAQAPQGPPVSIVANGRGYGY